MDSMDFMSSLCVKYLKKRIGEINDRSLTKVFNVPFQVGRTSKNSRQHEHDVIDFYGFNQSAFVENRKGQRKLKSFLKRS